jgi:hypothetical protein
MNPAQFETAQFETPSERLVDIDGFGILAWHQSAVLALE